MTQAEALIYLPISDEADLEELYEEKLFELKQFLLYRFPISKLIQARLLKTQNIEKAFVVLGGEVPLSKQLNVEVLPELNSIKEAFDWYVSAKNQVRLRMTSSYSLAELASYAQQLIDLTQHYAKAWILPNEVLENAPKVSAEANPMDIQDALTRIGPAIHIDSDYILTLSDDNCLKSEAKRLSLWLNFENNE